MGRVKYEDFREVVDADRRDSRLSLFEQSSEAAFRQNTVLVSMVGNVKASTRDLDEIAR